MHIIRVIIKGFKSYAAQLDFEPFSPASNVMVGKNGAGKSNFIDAIRFVLASDKYQKLRSDERKGLLHSGPGDIVLSGYVEIHFDNTDKRFPVETAQVVLRRSIGLKKDEYYLNNKHVSGEDVMNLLESAGFSRSNPYYIVIQGQVQALTKMTPGERLELLKEVAGTRVYDERRAESLKIMKESEGKKEKIEEVLGMLDSRLAELEEEKDELTAYRDLDRDRRALEFLIFEKELDDAKTEIRKIEDSRSGDSDRVNEVHQQSIEAHETLKAKEKELKQVNNDLKQLQKDKEFLTEEKKEAIRSRTRFELDLKDVEEKLRSGKKKDKDASAALKKIQSEIDAANKTLEEIRPKFAAAQDEEQKLKARIMERERKVQELYTKMGRSSQFKTRAERDAWIKKEVQDLKKTIASKEREANELADTIAQLKEKIETEKERIANREEGLQERRNALEATTKECNAKKEKRDEFHNRRRALWQEESELDKNLEAIREGIIRAERQLQSSMSKELSSGLAAVQKIVSEKNLRGVFGPLIELFECEDTYMTAIEVTAGNSLFHVVVDTDETASKLLEALNKQKAGRLTFIPLNKLEVKEPTYPSTTTVKPITEYMQFNRAHDKAFMQIFGKTLLASNLESASNVARMHKMNCVTLEGDKINAKGALTGGYHDARTSRLRATRDLKQLKQQLQQLQDKHQKTKSTGAEVDQRVTTLMAELETLEADRAKDRDTLETFQQEVRRAAKEVLGAEESLVQKERERTDLLTLISNLKASVKSLEEELKVDLYKGLSAAEKASIESLTTELSQLNKDIIESSAARASLEKEKSQIENRLTENLLPRKEEFEAALTSMQLGDQSEENQQRLSVLRDLSAAVASVEDIAQRQAKVDKDIASLTQYVNELSANIDELKNTELKATRSLQDESKKMESLLNKRSVWLQKREEAQRKIREIGSVPAESSAKFKGQAPTKWLKALQDTNAKLKGYSHVNKKALDQFVNFTEQKEVLTARKQDLDAGEKAIAELVTTLDRQKDEAIERTFKGVAKYFSQTFSELTGGGTATLIRQRKDVAEGEMPTFKGIEIKVAFTGEKEQKMSQLSGGQASLVALALIFAIQACDPAPFYVFDEIDPALDDVYRRNVAKMIAERSKTTQFIMISHRPELVEIAEKHYKMEYANRVSNVIHVDKEDAVELVRRGDEEDEEEEEEEEE